MSGANCGARLQRGGDTRWEDKCTNLHNPSVSVEHICTYVGGVSKGGGWGSYISFLIWKILKRGKESVNNRRLKTSEKVWSSKKLLKKTGQGDPECRWSQ